ncbi:MAG: ammonium transporter [Cyanobacteria bacterium P01_H01_bin.58]
MTLSSPEAFRNLLWITLSSFLVFLMQAGFLCVEAGLTRRKNNINVAIKNITDLGVSVIIFWAVGYGLMFGSLRDGVLYSASFLPDVGEMELDVTVFFLFQAMFCSTAVTILSGAVAERMTFRGYLLMAGLVSGVLYPVFGRWAWNGLNQETLTGWLGQRGFVDFAGSTVVHSVGGWAALAAVLIIGPRLGRFSPKRSPKLITSSDAPLALLGVLILWFGWFGFNGGSTLAFNAEVPRILVNTLFAGAAGLVAPLIWHLSRSETIKVDVLINGTLAGLVAITASCHAVSSLQALLIGAVGGLIMMLTTVLLKQYRIDDAVGAIPVHLGGGIWGTLAVALGADLTQLGTGLSRLEQLKMQLAGILACGLWTFTAALGVLLLVNRLMPLRVRHRHEYLGLNVAEHDAKSDLYELYATMKTHVNTGNLQRRVKADAFTEVGQIGSWYNQVVQSLEQVIARLDAIVMTAVDGIMTIDPDTLIVKSTNPAVERIFGHRWLRLIGQPVTRLVNVNDVNSSGHRIQFGRGSKQDELWQCLLEGCETGEVFEAIGIHRRGRQFPLEVTATTSRVGAEEFWTLMVRDVSDRKKTESALQQSELEARNNAQQLQATVEQLKQAQARLLQSEKMSSLGQIVAGVAHEINNPVGFIHGNLKHSRDYVQYLLQALDCYQTYVQALPPEVQTEIDELDLDFLKQDFPQLLNSMQHGTDRIQTIVQSLRNFSRFDESDCKVVDIHEGMENTLIMLAHQLDGGNGHPPIAVQKAYGTLPDVECYPGALNQVLLNILTNAVEALITRQDATVPNTIAITTRMAEMQGKAWVAIAIADNGDGMSESLQTKIFDPFFTTKEVGAGTGMGLAISHQIIVEQHGGQLQCQSKPGEGTRFVITLPVKLSDGQRMPSVLAEETAETTASIEESS